MSWFEHAANASEAANNHVLMFLAVAFDFPSGFVRLWSGAGDLVIGADTYTGVGDLGSVTMPPEQTALVANRKTFQLSGVDPALVPETEIDASYGRSVTEYFGFLNVETRTLLGTPEVNWQGTIDAIRRVDGPSPIIEVNAEHRMVALDEPDGWRYTHEHQQQFYAGDLGFDQVKAIQLKEVIWGGGPVDPAVYGPMPQWGWNWGGWP